MILPVISIWLVAKVFLCFAIFLYIVFAFVIVRQVSIMLATLELGFETPIRILSWLHLLFAIAVFVLALLIL
ncbi:hypothetical protein A2188_02185 [Candidatus Woesebacteria bacterium RIFOXYA1_FULL_43_9]|uniref:Uncharacterized protein n=1 Tax=Candidatus Woesebacteria bacterium RIFOXYA1_FULL_43_9 TaxID=1802534 RepID=A0A1F8CR89_9BACT|nr:MAG: hypothetical protein A2188_02185 [Candidatus Woesebacteria bacterium RIFOXYA1_FULL_43_9]